MPRLAPETKAQQLSDTAEAMVTLRDPFRVQTYIAAKWHVTTRQVRNWMREVRSKWRESATLDGRDLKRDEMRETLSAILRAALTRTEVVKDADDNPVVAMEDVIVDGRKTGERRPKLNAQGFPIQMTRPKPDLQRALHACAQLRSLDALDEPYRAKLIIDAELDAMPDFKNATPEGFEKMRELLQSIAPDRDLMKLAGDLFANAGRSTDALN